MRLVPSLFLFAVFLSCVLFLACFFLLSSCLASFRFLSDCSLLLGLHAGQTTRTGLFTSRVELQMTDAQTRARIHARARTRPRTHARARTHARTHARAHTRARTHARARTRARTHARAHTRARTHAGVHAPTCMHACVRVHVRVHVCGRARILECYGQRSVIVRPAWGADVPFFCDISERKLKVM